ncbi:GspH/FimT family pseudopilin [Azotobacter salinestris]|uniref:GspH/FimT family pseudopilin n=1 Tax=Azotobacter salinestris TaxID=69964 RepID=UPI001266A122|nr:GspH/FimT family pseudopilin [Azotobacter salinestris]
MRNIQRRYARGFTLGEALTSTAILGILLSLAVPAFTHLSLNSQKNSAAQQVRSLLSHARSIAVTMRKTTSLCGSRNGHSCVKTEIRFFIVFVDRNLDGKADPGELIRQEPVPPGTRYQVNASSLFSIRFRPNGTASSYGSIALCPSAENRYAARLIVSSMGRVRSARDSDGDGVVEGADGRPQSCPA